MADIKTRDAVKGTIKTICPGSLQKALMSIINVGLTRAFQKPLARCTP